MSIMRPVAAAVILGLAAGPVLAQQQRVGPPPFTAQQVDQGRAIYAENCAACHAPDLSGGPSGRPLKGGMFASFWATQGTTGALFKYLTEKMPPGRTGVLSAEQYAAVIALILNENGAKPGSEPLPSKYEELTAYRMGRSSGIAGGGGLALNVQLPEWPKPRNPAEKLTNVTDAMLKDPPPGDWLLWRRTLDGMGFSPLKQITKKNVSGLRLIWSFNLPAGPNPSTPLVHDGVMFMNGSGEAVHALDAATGEMLWRYSPGGQGGGGMNGGTKRNMALYQDKVYVATGDNNILALSGKTGEVLWKSPIPAGTSGGPLVVNGVVIQGMGRGRPAAGSCGNGGLIIGMSAADGKLLWTFNVIPQPGEFGTDSWNDLPCENRSGGTVWTTSYYDPDLNLVFSGTGNTFDTAALMKPVKPGRTNDALFIDSTLALNPLTGKLVWHYQHMGHELWDQDWAFEQQIIPLPVDGKIVKAVVTVGKPGILDAVDAANGRYLFSLDAGLQNIVQSIDPETGVKIYNPEKTPGETAKFICPSVAGAKNWMPSAYNPDTGILYVPMLEACSVMEPVEPGEPATIFTNSVYYRTAPRPNSDGRVGRVQAFDLKKRKVLWSSRQRAPLTSGVLATAGGLYFTGGLDRNFAAHDDATGKVLWQTRLGDVPSGAPISFMVDGKQYIAVITGYGSGASTMTLPLVPEIPPPPQPGSSIYVFAVD